MFRLTPCMISIRLRALIARHSAICRRRSRPRSRSSGRPSDADADGVNGLLKRFGLPLALAAGAGWLAFSAPFMGDYQVEALPAVHALLGGDLHGFLSQAPPYG